MKRNKVTKKWFGNWANEYDQTLGRINRHHKLLELAVETAKVKRGGRVLDIGCGTGLLSLRFLKKADCSVVGIDSSRQMLAIFKNKINKLGIQQRVVCKLADAENFKFIQNFFDIVASTVTLHHVKNKYPVIKRINKALRPGGRFILGDIDLDTTGKLTDPRRLTRIIDYLKQEFVLAIKEGGIEAFCRMYDNGKKHILNQGEYCIGFRQWKALCQKAKFKNITVKPLPGFEYFKVLSATK